MAVLKKRQRIILSALRDLGGIVTTRQIAERTGLHVNGVSQSLAVLYQYVRCLERRSGDTKRELIEQIPN